MRCSVCNSEYDFVDGQLVCSSCQNKAVFLNAEQRAEAFSFLIDTIFVDESQFRKIRDYIDANTPDAFERNKYRNALTARHSDLLMSGQAAVRNDEAKAESIQPSVQNTEPVYQTHKNFDAQRVPQNGAYAKNDPFAVDENAHDIYTRNIPDIFANAEINQKEINKIFKPNLFAFIFFFMVLGVTVFFMIASFVTVFMQIFF